MAESLQLKDFQLSLHRRGGEVSVFQLSDQDEGGSSGYKYYGFLNAEGGWVIQRADLSGTVFRWVGGTANYTTAWGNRTGLAYDYYNVLFGTPI